MLDSKESYDDTRINAFIRLKDMAQRKRADNDGKDCDGSDTIFVKNAIFGRVRSLTQKKL